MLCDGKLALRKNVPFAVVIQKHLPCIVSLHIMPQNTMFFDSNDEREKMLSNKINAQNRFQL